MKILKYKLAFLLSFLAFSATIIAQEDGVNQFEHQIIVGYNLGGTPPRGIPREVRAMKAWWPQFNPQLGYNISYKFTPKWGVGSGIMFDFKGMGVKAKVKYMHTRVVIEENSTRELEGYFSGDTRLNIRVAYVTIPIYATYRLNDVWRFKAGGYLSYNYSAKFKGSAYDGYLRVNSPAGEKVNITRDSPATYSFGDHIRDYDLGVLLGTQYKLNNRFGLYGDITYGLTPLFRSDFNTLDFKLYNFYVAIGMTYRL